MGAVLEGFVIRVLHLDHAHLGGGVHPIHKGAGLAVGALGAVALVVLVHVFGVLAGVPGEDRTQLGAVVLVGKVVFHMALGADQGTFFVAAELVPVLSAAFEPVLERLGVGAQLHGGRVVAVGAADGFVSGVDGFLAAKFVDVLGPEGIAVLGDPVHHARRFAVPAGGGHVALAVRAKAVEAINIDKVFHRVGVPARFIVFIHKRVAQPEIFKIGLGVLEALGQRVDAVVLVVGHGAFVLRHHLVFVVFHVRSVLLRKGCLEGGNARFRCGNARLVGGGLELGGNIFTAAKRQHGQQCGPGKKRRNYGLIHRLPSLC